MIFSKLDALASNLSSLETQGLRRERRSVESVSQGHMVVDGRRLLTFNSNDYLGLASHPQVVEAIKEGASFIWRRQRCIAFDQRSFAST